MAKQNSSALTHISLLRADPHPYPNYRVCYTESDLTNYFSYQQSTATIACDTESLPDGSPYCITFSHSPGTGRLIYRHNTKLIPLLHKHLINSPLLLFHNYLHDVYPFSVLNLPIHHFRDTLILSYLACLGGGSPDDDSGMAGRGSLSLKSLAYRYCNMRMPSFRDTVYPHSVPHLTAYLQSILSLLPPTGPTLPTCTCSHLRDSHSSRGPTGKLKGKCTKCHCEKYKLGRTVKDEDDKLLALLGRKVSNLLASIAEVHVWDFDDEDESGNRNENGNENGNGNGNGNEDVDVWSGGKDYGYTELDPYRRIRKWHPHDKEYLVELAGPVPKASVADVPEEALLSYACRDADATLRLYLFLQSYYPWLFY